MAFYWTTLTSSYDMNQNVDQNELLQIEKSMKSRIPMMIHERNTIRHATKKKWFTCPLTPPRLKSLMDLDRGGRGSKLDERRGSGVNSANLYRIMPAPPNTALAFSK